MLTMEFSQVNMGGSAKSLRHLQRVNLEGGTTERRCWTSFMTHSRFFLNSVFLESPYKMERIYLIAIQFIK